MKEHHDLVNAQLWPLADQINALSDLFNNVTLQEPSCLTSLDQWRKDAHTTVDQFYERKHRQFEQFVQERRNKQRKELEQMRVDVTELIREQEATQEQVDSIIKCVGALERDVNDLQHIPFNSTPLMIDDNLVAIRHETASNDDLSLPSPYQIMQSTTDSCFSKATSENHQLLHQKRNLRSSGKQNDSTTDTFAATFSFLQLLIGILSNQKSNIDLILNSGTRALKSF